MSHDRGCHCGLEPYEYSECQRAGCTKRRAAHDRFHNPQPADRAAAIVANGGRDVSPGQLRDRTDPEGGIPGIDRIATTTRIKPKYVERPARRIISVANPGHDVLLFMHKDGSAHAIISKPGDDLPTTVLIAPPEMGRCIAVERQGSTFDVVYKDEP